MATMSPVSTTLASKTTPNEPFPMIRSALYEILGGCGDDAAAAAVEEGGCKFGEFGCCECNNCVGGACGMVAAMLPAVVVVGAGRCG